ncbi:hypothetical protein Ddye_012076 [Dipteronia dyeriana]|uniref:Myb-related protein 123 n=1 Tax=Dipteronia dyeriana TaxID=168575 RepID=A0AAD9X3S6_9ROSI|nr:hypothetical protein Ddye_012076 [Dipteronia dyeriana]
MGRSPCCAKEGLNRGAWTATEDKILTDYIKINGEGKWRNLPKRAGLKRCGKSCRLRWLNYLRPDIKRGNISHDEEELIIRLHKLLGNRWSLIAGRLPGRTDNEIKNYWNTNIGKKLQDHHQQQISSPKKPMPTDFQPIRTKASKCTKAIITTPEPQRCSQQYCPDTEQVTVAVEPDHDHHYVIKGLDSFPGFNLGDDHNHNSSDYFLKDFEMDENFLSEFLYGVDFSELAANNFDTIGNRGDNNSTRSSSTTTNNTSCCERGYSYLDSDHHQDDKLQDSDFSFMDSIMGSEFGWFCD